MAVLNWTSSVATCRAVWAAFGDLVRGSIGRQMGWAAAQRNTFPKGMKAARRAG